MEPLPGQPESPTLTEWIKSHTIRSVSGKSFVLTEQLKTWLGSSPDGSDTQTLKESLFNAVNTACGPKFLTETSVPKNAALVSCILLELGLARYMREFSSYGITDNSLPVSISDLRDLAGDLEISETKLVLDFYEMQWRFCPAVFELDMDEEWPPEMIIPICAQDAVAEGRTARVYEVSIPEDFVGTSLRQVMSASRYENPESPARWFYRFALKTFDGLHAKLGKKEIAAFRVLQSHDNLLRPLAAFATRGNRDLGSSPEPRTVYSILFEYGDLDLSDYFAAMNPPITLRETKNFWRNLCGVVDAVAQLHRIYKGTNTYEDAAPEITGYHHDIKPSNIILSGGRFKLSDFGFASFVSKDQELISSSAAFGTISYGPPSPNLYTTNPTLESLQKFDVWSLGCVFSEAATWVVLGKSGVEQFQDLRRRRSSAEPGVPNAGALSGDSFHDGTDVLSCVTSWHRVLRGETRKSDALTAKILDIVDGGLLVGDSEKRIDVGILLSRLKLAFEQSGLASPLDIAETEGLKSYNCS